MKGILISIVLVTGIAIFINVNAQKINHTPLECKGNLPGDFTTLSQIKSKVQMEEERKQHKSNYSQNQKKAEFISHSNYLIDELLLSGRVLFNDPLSDYLSIIADKILENEKPLREKIRVYVMRSDLVNAFTTNNGLIFVTTGLISEVENEAQLAFILSHEITHYEKRHVINAYLKNEKIFSSNSGKYRYNTYDDKIEEASNYSKELEFQSDSMGIFRLSRTSYSINEAVKSMDILQYSDLPFDEIKFDPSFLENENYIIPAIFFLDSVTPINLDRLENENDSRSSHPNIKSRREMLKSYHEKLRSSSGNEKFLQGKEKFEEIQHLARMETLRLLLNERRYAETVYECFVLMQKDTANKYLENSIGKALYGMAKYKTADEYFETAESYSYYEGEIQQCMHLFYKLSPEQLNFIACRYLYDLNKKNNTKFYSSITRDLFIDLVNKYGFSYDKIELKCNEYQEKVKLSKTVTIDSLKNTDSSNVNEEELSKYDRFRKQKDQAVTTAEKTTIDAPVHEFYYGVFGNLINDEEFKKFMTEIEEAAVKEKESKEEEEKITSEMTSYERRQKDLTEKNSRRKKGLSLGIDKVIIVDPFYFQLDSRYGISLVNSEKKLVNFSVDIEELSQMAGLEREILAPKLFTEKSVESYNSMSLFNFWAGERLDHENIDIIPLESEYAAEAGERLGTDKIIFSGVFSYREKKENIGLAILFSIIPYTAPFGIIYLVQPNLHTYYYTMLFDLDDGNCYLNETIHFNMGDKRGLLRSSIYDLMLQIKRVPRSTK